MAVIVVDAGVLVGGLSVDDAHHHGAAAALRDAVAKGNEVVIPATAFAEALVHPFRKGGDAVDRVDAFIRALGGRVEPVTEEIARLAASLRAVHRGLRLPDCVVLATGQALRAPLLTTDAGWPRIPDIKVTILSV